MEIAMRRSLLSLVFLACVCDLAVAQELYKAKLRAAIELPYIKLAVDIPLRVGTRDDFGNRWDVAREIAKETKRLDGTVDDAEVFLKVAEWHLFGGDEVKMWTAIRKAKELLQPHLNTSDPKRAYLLAWYSDALLLDGTDSWEECERLGARALKLAAEDWRVWEKVGSYCELRTLTLSASEGMAECLAESPSRCKGPCYPLACAQG
jgi:hypothetical protein